MFGIGGGGWGPDSTRGLDKHPGSLKTFLKVTKRLPKNETFTAEKADEAPFRGATDESIEAFATARKFRRSGKRADTFFKRLLQRFK